MSAPEPGRSTFPSGRTRVPIIGPRSCESPVDVPLPKGRLARCPSGEPRAPPGRRQTGPTRSPSRPAWFLEIRRPSALSPRPERSWRHWLAGGSPFHPHIHNTGSDEQGQHLHHEAARLFRWDGPGALEPPNREYLVGPEEHYPNARSGQGPAQAPAVSRSQQHEDHEDEGPLLLRETAGRARREPEEEDGPQGIHRMSAQ